MDEKPSQQVPAEMPAAPEVVVNPESDVKNLIELLSPEDREKYLAIQMEASLRSTRRNKRYRPKKGSKGWTKSPSLVDKRKAKRKLQREARKHAR